MIAKLITSTSFKSRVEEIEKILSDHGLKRPHPDLLYFSKGEKLGVEQVKVIGKHLSSKPVTAKGKGVVLENAEDLTDTAQNALLKTLEEPPLETLIILSAISEAGFLSTVLSRCQIIKLNRQQDERLDEKYQEDLENLLVIDVIKRFEYIEKLKDRSEFLQFLVAAFREKFLHSEGKDKEIKNFLKESIEAEKWAAQNVNIRGILEYLMLIMPGTENSRD